MTRTTAPVQIIRLRQACLYKDNNYIWYNTKNLKFNTHFQGNESLNKTIKEEITNYHLLPMIQLLNETSQWLQTQSLQRDPDNANYRQPHFDEAPVLRTTGEKAYKLTTERDHFKRFTSSTTGVMHNYYIYFDVLAFTLKIFMTIHINNQPLRFNV